MCKLLRSPFQHPWLRLQRVLRAILTEEWNAEAWRQIKPEITTVFAARRRVWRAGWFN